MTRVKIEVDEEDYKKKIRRLTREIKASRNALTEALDTLALATEQNTNMRTHITECVSCLKLAGSLGSLDPKIIDHILTRFEADETLVPILDPMRFYGTTMTFVSDKKEDEVDRG